MGSTFDILSKDTRFGFLDRTVESGQIYHPVLVDNVGANTMLKSIRDELKRAKTFTFSVAFISPSAVSLLKQPLLDFAGRGTILTSTYLGFNAPEAFREVLALPNVDVMVLPDESEGFHAKGYIFEQEGLCTAIVGSSNLTANALVKNAEWNLRFSALPDGDIVDQLTAATHLQINRANPLTEEWIDAYEESYVRRDPPKRGMPGVLPTKVIPNAMQREALAEIQKYRDLGERRAVVVSATGTGKTILSALDVRNFAPQKMLFLVHREQILDRAIEEFQRVLADEERSAFGKFVGGVNQLDRKYVFSTIQSLSRPEILKRIDPTEFDYVLIDEVHRAGGDSYKRVLHHLDPEFLLGVTATPERTDGFNVYELFDFNVPYEIRLNKALENEMLVPFHYFGVTDYEVDGVVQVGDTFADLARLVMPERIDHVVRSLERYGQRGVEVRGLIFCSRKAEAVELSLLLNQRYVDGKLLRTRAISGDTSISDREQCVQELEQGDLDYILTVDVFNEGIDIPSVNQIVMLRQTQSSIIFTQQLGRGLRKLAGKEYLVVIDFIGNYTNNYLIPIALFGDSSLDRDQIRKKMIDAEDTGVIQGVSSVNFDRISRQRVLDSIAKTNLGSAANLKKATIALEARLGRPPTLIDFARFESVDPVVIAGYRQNLWATLVAFKLEDEAPNSVQDRVLSFMTSEILNGKRLHELILLDLLIDRVAVSRDEFKAVLVARGCVDAERTIDSVIRVLTLEFFTAREREKYGDSLVAVGEDGRLEIASYLRGLLEGGKLSIFLDIVETGLFLGQHRYDWRSPLTVGARYSRKDVCRLLDWKSNEYSTMYGYKVDYETGTLPIFITFHKSDDVTASTRYEDALINESTIKWFTKSKRTLRSPEIRAIKDPEVDMHVFGKKDDAEGKDFYYLGVVDASDLQQQKMVDDSGMELDVVTMNLTTESPIELSLYDYLRGAGIDV